MQSNPLPCPAYKHCFVVCMHMQEQLGALVSDHEKAFQSKLHEWKQTRKATGEPRRSRIPVQQYICCCYLLHSRGQSTGGSCLICQAAGGSRPSCPVCNCQCTASLFKDSEHQDIARTIVNRSTSKAPGPVTSKGSTKEKLGHFVAMVSQQGACDLQANGDDATDGVAVQGAAAFHLRHAQFEDDVERRHLREMIGPISDAFPDGTPFADIVGQKKSMQFYRNGLGNSGQIPAGSSSSAAATVSPPKMERCIRKKI